MKAAMLSVKPRWCELIASGKKTIEVRKTRPKLETPFKCYIYCTNGSPYLNRHNGFLYLEEKDILGGHGVGFYERLSGRVIGEFACRDIEHIEEHRVINVTALEEFARLTLDELLDYVGDGAFYAWHVYDLVIYDKLRELSEFGKTRYEQCDGSGCYTCEHWQSVRVNSDEFDMDCSIGREIPRFVPLKRPPQSWCYVDIEEAGQCIAVLNAEEKQGLNQEKD